MRNALMPALLGLCLTAGSLTFAVDCPEGTKNVAIVTITLGDTIDVDPAEATIWKDAAPNEAARVCWVVEGLPAGKTVHIGSSKAGQNHFTKSKRKIKGTSSNRAIASGSPRQVGKWEYNVWVTLTGELTPIDVRDPAIIIRNTGVN